MLFNFEEGEQILIDKPFKWTSFDVVKKVRNTIKVKKVGHAGTLDPLATGLLVICTGKKTKQIDSIQAQSKEYTGTLVLGATTPSYDLETEPVLTNADFSALSLRDLINATAAFVGEIDQKPPIYSAVKVDGVRLYKKARIGETVEIKSRKVTITEFIIESMELPYVRFRVKCSKGTYIRSLVHDYGEALNTGAYLSELRRERIGDFNVSDAFKLEEFLAAAKESNQNQL